MSMRPELSQSARSQIDDYISKAIVSLTAEHPNWKNPGINQPTICIPPYFETVRKNVESENLAVDRKGNRGDVNEQKVFDALKTLSNGAVVVANINSIDIKKYAWIVWKDYKRLCASTPDFDDDAKNAFQCDFMIFHQEIGIVLIEVKSTEGIDKHLPKDAARKFAKTIGKIKMLLRAITGGDDCQIPVKAVFCCPNLVMTGNENYSFETESIKIDIIAANCVSMAEIFANWPLEAEEKCTVKNFVDHFLSVVAFFCCYRRAIYLNEVLNAVEVAKIIDRQYLRPCPQAVVNDNTIGPIFASFSQLERVSISNLIILTEEQKAIIDCNEQCQLVFGPPGTGKTLVFVMKLLKAMREESKNRLVVLTFLQYTSFRSKLKKIISSVPDPKRMPTLFEAQKDIESSDDVYCDEFGSQSITFLTKRQKADGNTFAVFTGVYLAGDYNQCKTAVQSMSAKYRIHYLEKVMRGTVNIVEYWKKKMYISSADFIVGHGIKGPTVLHPQIHPTFHDTLTAIYNQVQALIGNGAQPRHIAVINDSRRETDIIIQFLRCKGIRNISARRLRSGRNAVVVDYYRNVYSMEWPFVIVCSLTNTGFYDEFFLIASSRAIAHLTVISFDFHSMQRFTEDALKKHLKKEVCSTWKELRQHTEVIVRKYLREINEQTQNETLFRYIQVAQYSSAVHRLDIVVTSSEKRPQPFQPCQRLTDCLKVFVQNPNWMRYFVEKYWDAFESLKQQYMKVIITSMTNTTWKFSARRTKRFYHHALKLDETSEEFILYRDFGQNFAVETTAYFARKVYTDNAKNDKEQKTIIEVTPSSDELMEELFHAMVRLIGYYLE